MEHPMKKLSLAFFALVSSVSACGDVERPPSNPWLGSGGATPGAVASNNAPSVTATPDTMPTRPPGATTVERLEGTAGEVRNFASAAPSLAMYAGGRGFRLTATDATGRWQMMAQLEFAAPLTDATWPVGTSRTINLGGVTTGTEAIRAISCSGPSRADYTFDATPRQVTVQVSAGSYPDSRVVTFTQTFDAAQRVTGAFEYSAR
jgi:hypothetical protein